MQNSKQRNPKMATKKPYPIERYIERVKDFYAKNGRAPMANECHLGQSTNKHLVKHFGSWDAMLQKVLGVRGKKIRWSDEEFKILFDHVRNEKQRLPMTTDFTRNQINMITRHIGSITGGCEKYLGNSVRMEVMRCVDELMPAGVDAPTTHEILDAMKRKNFSLNINEMRGILNFCVRQEFVECGRYDRTVWWKLTASGKEFLKGKTNGKDRT